MSSEVKQSDSEDTLISTWYEDSLSLVNPSADVAKKWRVPFSSVSDVKLEILYVAPIGTELLAHGNPVNCRS